jgi:hypothetical protein
MVNSSLSFENELHQCCFLKIVILHIEKALWSIGFAVDEPALR